MITILICLSQGSICRSGQTQARQAPDSAHPGRPCRPERPLVARPTRPRVSGRAQGGEGIPTTDAMKRPCSANPSQASTTTSQQAHASPSPRCAIASVFDDSGTIPLLEHRPRCAPRHAHGVGWMFSRRDELARKYGTPVCMGPHHLRLAWTRQVVHQRTRSIEDEPASMRACRRVTR